MHLRKEHRMITAQRKTQKTTRMRYGVEMADRLACPCFLFLSIN